MTFEIIMSDATIKNFGDLPGLRQLSDSANQKVVKEYYGKVIDIFEILLMINTQEEYDRGMYENFAMCKWGLGKIYIFRRISMECEEFCNAPAEEKLYQAAKTALEVIKFVGKRARGRLDHRKLLRDVFSAYDESIQERLLSEGFKLPNITRPR